jgi:hypothetical protein
MRVLGFGEIDGRQYAWCEWCDEKNVARSQQFPVLALAVDLGGPWAAGWRLVVRGRHPIDAAQEGLVAAARALTGDWQRRFLRGKLRNASSVET